MSELQRSTLNEIREKFEPKLMQKVTAMRTSGMTERNRRVC